MCLRFLKYLSQSVGAGTDCGSGGGSGGRARNLGRSEDIGGGGGVWDSWDDTGLGAAAVGDS